MEKRKANGKVSGVLFFGIVVVFTATDILSHNSCDGETADRVDPIMGDWQGKLFLNDGKETPLAAQVIALGNGWYRVNLVGEFDSAKPPFVLMDGYRSGGMAVFVGKAEKGLFGGTKWRGAIEWDTFSGAFEGKENGRFVMHKVERLSPTLGVKPPKDAVVLFDGKNYDAWQCHGESGPIQWLLIDGAMEIKPGSESIISKRDFQDCQVHLEFRTPFQPEARGQGRGNSGVYLQGKYEVQVLDSYGLEGLDNECGGIYGVARPKINMCAPPLQWQTYDITFYAPRFENSGKKVQNARMTVLHNGVEILDNIEIPGPTAAAGVSEESKPGGIYLQNHGNAVWYRNIWVKELNIN